MKKLLSIVLIIAIIFSLSACGKKSAEKYCFSCGEGIPKNATFCEHCGTKIENEKTESTNDNSDTSQTTSKTTVSTSSTTSNSTQANTSKVPTHTHSYSKKVTEATCTAQGYTTHTCSCGYSYKDTYTNPSHNYSNYKCLGCGQVDKLHAYEYLAEWIKANGNQEDQEFQYIFEGNKNSSKYFVLSCSADGNFLSAGYFDGTDIYPFGTFLNFDIYYYGSFYSEDAIYGYIDAATYTVNTNLTYTDSNCSVLKPSEYLSTARSAINMILAHFKEFLINNNLGITLKDLGFKSF